MKNRTLIIAALVALFAAASCGGTTPTSVLGNLNRPTDMVTACYMRTLEYGSSTPTALIAQPMVRCHPPGQRETGDLDPNAGVDEKNPGPRQVPYTLSFVPNTIRSELSIIDLNPLNRRPMRDLETTQLGAGTVPLGQVPEHIAASDDSCRLATANRGSCDLTLLDGVSLARLASGMSSPGTTAVTTVRPITSSGRELGASPAEIAFVPQDVTTIPTGGDLCSAGRWSAVVTFPGCNLVALVELPSGRILDSYRHGAGGALIPAGTEPVCPRECGGAGAGALDAGAGDDGGAGDGGAGAQAGASALVMQPAGVALPDGSRAPTSRVYVGSLSDDGIAVLDVSATGLTPQPPIVLHESPRGVSRLRLSMDPYAARLTGSVEQDVTAPISDPESFAHGSFVGHRGAYLYAFAGDGSVRVAEVTAGVECDVAVDILDPLFTSEPARRGERCFAVGAAGTPRRRFGAVGPGLRVSTLPMDISFKTYHLFGENDVLVREGNSSGSFYLGGAFGYLLTVTGTTYVLNVDPVLRRVYGGDRPEEHVPLSNSLRDVNVVPYRSSLSSTEGPPRLEVDAVSTIQDAHTSLLATLQPQLEQVTTGANGPDAQAIQLDPRNTVATPHQTQVVFPARETVHPQTWVIGWERSLPGSSRITGAVREDGGFDDVGANFCKVGVQPGDMLVLTGCIDDASCGVGRKCYLSPASPQATGLCYEEKPTGTSYQDLTQACDALTGSLKRYEITEAGPTHLALRPRIDEAVKTSLNRCTPGATYNANEYDPCNPPELMDPLPSNTKRFTCLSVAGVPRCVQTCVPGAVDVCRSGRVCAAVGDLGVSVASDSNGLCADAPPLTTGETNLVRTCLSELAPYQVQVGRAFTVEGSTTAPAQLTREVKTPDGRWVCEPLAGAPPLPILRLSLEGPECTNLPADKSDTLAILSGVTPSPDPCLYSVQVGTAAVPRTEIKALFQNRELRFVLRNLDMHFGSMQIRFTVSGGSRAQTVAFSTLTEFGLPLRIISSPMEMSIRRAFPDLTLSADAPGFFDYTFDFVVDSRPVGRITTGGQVVRMHGPTPVFESLVGGDNVDSASYFPVY